MLRPRLSVVRADAPASDRKLERYLLLVEARIEPVDRGTTTYRSPSTVTGFALKLQSPLHELRGRHQHQAVGVAKNGMSPVDGVDEHAR
jgi:hypothetical protein